MIINLELKEVLLVVGLHNASRDAIAKGLPTCEDLEYLFSDLADDISKVEASFQLIVDTIIVTEIEIHSVLFVFDCFTANIVDPNFVWANFTRAVYVADKPAHTVTKVAKTTMAATNTMTTPVSCTIDFSTNVLTADAVANLKHYYLQLQTMGVSFNDKTKSHFFLSALQHKCIEVDWFVYHLDSIPYYDILPDEVTLTELILRIKDSHSFQNSVPAIIHRYARPTNGKEFSTTRPNYQSSYSDSCFVHDFFTRSDTQCICGHLGHSVENCQQMAIQFLIAKYLQKDANLASASWIPG
jgi:hypothetical protein